MALLCFSFFTSAQRVEAVSWKQVCKVSLITVSSLIAAPAGVLSGHQVFSNWRYYSKPCDESVVNAEGASITAGTGASLPLQMRIRHHLQANNIDIEALLKDQDLVIMADYFFPTKFTGLSTMSEHEIDSEVDRVIHAALDQYDFVLIGLLPESDNLDPIKLNSLAADHPVRFVFDLLETDPTTKRNVKAVNKKLQALAKTDSRIVVLNPRPYILMDTKAYSEELIERGAKALDLVPDRIHPNDNGQALFFNLVILPGLEKIPALKGVIPEMGSFNSYQTTIQTLNGLPVLGRVSTDFAELAISSQVGSADEFAARTRGLYWAAISSDQKAKLKASEALETSNDSLAQYSASKEDLQGIQSAIRSLSAFMPSGLPVTIIENSEGRSIALNLAQALFYTSIELNETSPGSGVFEAYGYDFWYSVDSGNPPKVNYFFRASFDSENKNKLIIYWEILPLVRSDQGEILQDDPLLRLGYLDAASKDYLQLNRDRMPKLQFEIEVKIR